MGRSHGKNTVVIINGTDLSAFCNNSDWKRSPDKTDVTTYGASDKVYDGSLRDGTSSIQGFYDTATSNGPRAILEPLEGTVVPMIYRPEGTGAGKPQRTVNVFVGEYAETHPVSDYVGFTCALQHSGPVARATQ